MFVDDAGAAGQVAVFGGVADREAHIVEPALLDEVNNHFEFVQALEVSHFRGVAAFDQGLKGGLNQGGYAAAEDGLLAEKVGFGFVLESGRQDAGFGAADAFGVSQADGLGVAGGVLMHRQEAGDADAFDKEFPYPVAGGFGGDHQHIDIVRGQHFPVVDAETVGKHQGGAGAQIGGNLLAVGVALHMVGNQHHQHIGGGSHFRDIGDGQAGFLSGGAAAAFRVEADDDLLAVVFEVEGVGVALAAIADDADSFAGQGVEVGVIFVVDVWHLRYFTFLIGLGCGFRVGLRYLVGADFVGFVDFEVVAVVVQDQVIADPALGFAAHHSHPAGTHQFEDAERLEEVEEGVDFVAAAGYFDDHRHCAHIHDFAAEGVNHLEDFAAGFRGDFDFDEGQFPGDHFLAGDVGDFHHLDEFVQLLGALVDVVLVALDIEGHPGQALLLAVADSQAGNVEAAAAEQGGDAGQDAGFVLNQGDNGVVLAVVSAHFQPTRSGRGSSIISLTDSPAGIIG